MKKKKINQMHCKRIKLFYPIIEPFVWTYLSSIFWEVYTVLSEDSTCDLLWVNELIIQKKIYVTSYESISI